MKTLQNTVGIFTIKVEPVTDAHQMNGKPLPDYCRFAISLSPGRMMFKDTRNKMDVFYLHDIDSAMWQYKDFIKYAHKVTDRENEMKSLTI